MTEISLYSHDHSEGRRVYSNGRCLIVPNLPLWLSLSLCCNLLGKEFVIPPLELEQNARLSTRSSLFVSHYEFDGNTIFTDFELAQLTAPYANRKVNLPELEELRQKLTIFYTQNYEKGKDKIASLVYCSRLFPHLNGRGKAAKRKLRLGFKRMNSMLSRHLHVCHSFGGNISFFCFNYNTCASPCC